MIGVDENFYGLIVGASGFVGRHLSEILGPTASATTYWRNPIDGGVRFDAQTESLRMVLEASERPFTHVFLLYGAIDMEGCARDPAATRVVNVDSVQRMIDDTIAYGALPIYASTDYIFDGSRGPWTEDDAAYPVMEYGRQKLDIENYLRTLTAPWLATRLSKVVGGARDTHSMLGQWVNDIVEGRKMRCADDQIFSPCYVRDVATLMVKLVQSDARGLYNLAGTRPYARIELLQLLVDSIREIKPDLAVDMEPASLHDMPFLEKRPLNTSLDISKLRSRVDHNFKDMPELCKDVAQEHFLPH